MTYVKKVKSFLVFREMRFTAYRNFSAWIHFYETLGRGNRFVIPSCVVREIRENYPDFNGQCTGFKNFQDIEDS